MILRYEKLEEIFNDRDRFGHISVLGRLSLIFQEMIKEKLDRKVNKDLYKNQIPNVRLVERSMRHRKVVGVLLDENYKLYIDSIDNEDVLRLFEELGIKLVQKYVKKEINDITGEHWISYTTYCLDISDEVLRYLKTRYLYNKLMNRF